MPDFKVAPTVNGDKIIATEVASASEQTTMEDTNRIPLVDDGVVKYAEWDTVLSEIGAGIVTGARVYNNANIAIPLDTWTALTFNSENFDTDDLHSIATNTGRLTAPVTGKYLITSNVTFAANSGLRGLRIKVNGTTIIASQMTGSPTTPNANDVSVTSVYALTAGEYVTVEVFQNWGSSLNVLTDSVSSPGFSMMLLDGMVGPGIEGAVIDVGDAFNAASVDTPLDADKFVFWDVVDSALKSISWTNIKATLKTYFDTLYTAINTAVLLTGAQTIAGIKTFSEGISFGGATLDIYETGTFTPIVADHPSAGNVATGTFRGFYTRFGNFVQITIELTNINTAGMTAGNNLHIRNLPYAALNATGYQVVGSIMAQTTALNGFQLTPFIFANTSYITLWESNTGANWVRITVGDLVSGASDFLITITYVTN